jgi:hypothetical protein
MNSNVFTSTFSGVSFLRDTKSVGDLSELMVAAALAHPGYTVSLPGENARYDLVIDKDGVLSRVQVKTGRLRSGSIQWNCCSTHTHRNGPATRPYIDEIDFFGVYCPQLDSTYLIPIAVTSRTCSSLRVATAKNSQVKRVRWAEEYLISRKFGASLIEVGKGALDGVAQTGSTPS